MTSRTPSEVYAVLGPHGVEELLHQARNAVWREYPPETRSFEAVRARTVEVFGRNMKVWAAIKKPTPEAFFQDLLPHAADGHIRQALVLTWMMMPRAGGREFKDTVKIARTVFDRMLQAWEEDNGTFTGKSAKRAKVKKAPAKAAKVARRSKKVAKKSAKAAKKKR